MISMMYRIVQKGGRWEVWLSGRGPRLLCTFESYREALAWVTTRNNGRGHGAHS